MTRAVLERLAERRGLSVSITTKSDQVVRDIDLLKRISAQSSLTINVTIVTLRTRLARMLEPRAPRPDLRFAAVRKLRDAGLAAGVFMMPVLPGLTDSDAHFERMAEAAKDADVRNGLRRPRFFWMPSAAKEFLPFIEEKFPRLAQKYREFYGRAAYAPQTYRHEVSERLARNFAGSMDWEAGRRRRFVWRVNRSFRFRWVTRSRTLFDLLAGFQIRSRDKKFHEKKSRCSCSSMDSHCGGDIGNFVRAPAR